MRTSFNHLSLTCEAMILAWVLMGLSATAQSWTNRYNGPANSLDSPNAMAVDANGNVYVTGVSANSQNTSAFNFDWVTIKYAGVPPLPPYFESSHLSGGSFASDLCGASGSTVVVQVSTNLTDWAPLSTNVLGADPLPWRDPQNAQFPQRFYRLVQL